MANVTRQPWPALEAHIRARLARGAIVTRQGEWVQTEIPGGSIAWSRAVYFDRATQTNTTDAVAVLPTALAAASERRVG
jgi:hypothetical protein